MDFNLIKKCNKKVNLWTGIISFTFLIVSLIIIFVLTSVEIKIRTMIGIQVLINNLLVWLLIVFINFSPTMIKNIFRIVNYRHPQKQNLEKIKFSLAKQIHPLIFLVGLIIWFIEITSFMFATQNWILAFKDYWWICLIIMVFNIALFYINFLMANYLYNHQPEILKSLN